MKKFICIVFVALLTSVSYGQAFVNGELDGGTGISVNPPSWNSVPFTDPNCLAGAAIQATSDVCDQFGPNLGGGIAGIPFSGISMVTGLQGTSGGLYWHEGIMQTVNGFTIGCSYDVTFYQAVCKQSNALDQTGSWRMIVDNTIVGTSAISTSVLAATDVNLQWEQRTITFTATAATHTFKFLPQDDDGDQLLGGGVGGAIRMAIDLIAISVGTAPTITAVGPFCTAQAPVILVGNPPGGTWAGTGITNTTTGEFDPGTAGVGAHTITYTVMVGCGSGSATTIIDVTASSNAGWTSPGTVCETGGTIDLNTLITGDLGGTWTGTGVTGSIFDPLGLSGAISITYDVGAPPCDDSNTQNITVTPQASGAWTPPVGLCSSSALVNLDLLITGTTGGTWSGTGVTGNMFDPAVGTQSVTYTVGTAPCDDVSAQTITIVPSADATWTNPGPLCQSNGPINLDLQVTGTAGGTWSGTGVTGNMFDPTGLNGNITVTYAVGTAPCDDILALDINVITVGNASWTPPVGLCSSAALVDLDLLVTGTAGGTWSGTGVTGNMFDPAVGTQTITYTVGVPPCDDVSAQAITIVPSSDATWTNPGPLCQADGPINLDGFVTGTAGGTWSGTGVTGNMFDPAGLSGNITVTYMVGTAPCDDVLALDINVIALANASWTPPTGLCVSSPQFDLNTVITGTPGGTWSGTGVTGNMFDPSVGTQTITYTVGSGTCQQVSAQQITVGTGGNPAWTTLTMCVSDAPINLTGQVTGDPGGTWTGTGITGSVFDPFFGTQSITYTVGAVGCQQASTQTITVIDPQLALTATAVSCFGAADGSATVTVTGGSGTQTYLWNPSAQTTQTANGLGPGNYQVTVTDGTCIVTGNVDVIEPVEITLAMIGTNGCAPALGAANVQATGGVGGFTYNWTPSGQTNDTAIDLDSAMHTVVVTDGNGCTATDSVLVQILPPPTITTIADTTIIYPNCITMPAIGGVSYAWTPSDDLDCDDCPAPTACPMYDTQYCVTGTDASGCVNSDCVMINVDIICGEVFVPSAFSPNNDGENDLECVYSDCLESFTFTIYNRWGEVVFETSNETICWDGTWKNKELNSAVFVYILDGYLINGEHVNQKGNISLVR